MKTFYPKLIGNHEQKMCGSKKRYENKTVAEDAIKKLIKLKSIKNLKTLNAYFCRYCHYWHIGHTSPRP